MSAFVFRCPSRGLMVQGWADDTQGEPAEYVAYRCPACAGVHLVNPKTGKLLSEQREADMAARKKKKDES